MILKYILNSLLERKLRTLVMLLSVTLSTTLLFVSLGIGASYESAQRKMAIGYAGKASITIRNSNESAWITKSEIPELSGLRHVVGLLTADGLYAENGYYENFDVLATDLSDLEIINPPQVQSGGLAGFDGYQIALPDRFASKFGIQAGDTIRLKVGGEYHSFDVAAICTYDTIFLRNTRGFNALIPFETMTDILGTDGAYSELLIVTDSSADSTVIKGELSDKMEPGIYSISSVYSETAVAADARQKSMPFYLISFFTLTISAFIIYSSYKIITSERLPVLGTFRSIGADRKTIRNILMTESLVYGIAGSLLGIPAGYLTLWFLLHGMSDTASYGIKIPLVVSAQNIVLSCIISIAVSVLGAYIPIQRASKLPIKEVVFGTVEDKPPSNTRIMFAGMILFVTSILLPRMAGDPLLIPAGGFSLLTLIISAIIMIPLWINTVSRVLESIYGKIFGNIGKLAARNLRENKNVCQNATLLFISISALIVISVVGSFVQMYIGDVFRGAKLDGFTDAAMSPEFVQEIGQLDGMDEMLPVQVMNNMVQAGSVTLGRVEATDDLAAYGAMFALSYENEGHRERVEREFADERNILLSSDCLKRLGVTIGDSVTLTAAGHTYEYLVTGNFKIRATNTDAIIPSAYAVRDFDVQNYGLVAYTAEHPDAVMAQIRDLFGERSHWSRTIEEFNSDAYTTIHSFLSPMNNLTWFILLLAAVGIVNNLLINHIQKRRSIALYKSVGLSNMQNIKMTLIESFSVGLLGALMAVAVSYLEIKTVFLVAGPRISLIPELKTTTFLFAAFMGIVITLIGSIMPVMKTASMKLVEEIKFE